MATTDSQSSGKPKKPTAPSGTDQADTSSPVPPSGDQHSSSKNDKCKNMLLCITAGVVAVAIAVPVLSRICGICSKDDDDADAEHSKVASNSVLTKLVGWVNEVKDGEDKAEDDDDKGYEEMSVRDFESSQSL